MSIICDSMLAMAFPILIWKGFKLLYSFYICSFIGPIRKLSILSGKIEFLEAIYTAAFSKELNGLSKIRH